MAFSPLSEANTLGITRQLNQSTARLTASFERLSSGLRINRASDDAAGLAIADSLRVDGRVYGQAIRNGNDGVSQLNIAGAALQENTNILIRLKELANQAANGSLSLSQRTAIDQEGAQLVEEFNRIAASTEFNGVDLLVENQNATGIQLGYGTNGVISFTLGNELERNVGDGTFTSGSSFSGVDITGGLALGDFNGDGVLDFVGGDTAGSDIQVALGDGAGGTTTSAYLLTSGGGTTFKDATIGDFNGDGNLDVITISDNAVDFFAGNGDGTFAAGVAVGNTGTQIEAGDFNNDGNLDFVLERGGNSYTQLGNGDGTFQTEVALPAATGFNNFAVGDINGDGVLDIAGKNATMNLVQIYTGNGDGTFTTGQSAVFTNKMASIEIGDVNNDGYDDIAITLNSGSVEIALGQSDGTVDDGNRIALGADLGTTSLALGDLNGDGNLDVITSGGSGTSSHLGDGEGGFTLVEEATPTTSGEIILGDLDNDGALDILSSNTQFVTTLADTEKTTTLGRLYLLDQEGALAAFETIDDAMERVSSELGVIGANVSRIGVAISNLHSAVENYATAESRIRDVDVAEEAANLTRLQILQNAGTAVLAQANQLPNLVLNLLST